jgi:hypothetical protein
MTKDSRQSESEEKKNERDTYIKHKFSHALFHVFKFALIKKMSSLILYYIIKYHTSAYVCILRKTEREREKKTKVMFLVQYSF